MEEETKICTNCSHPSHAGAMCSDCDCDMSAEGGSEYNEPTTEAEPQM